jgi:hypothetical protein
MIATRAQYLGIQPGRLSAKTRRKTDKIRALLTEIAVDWGEADSAVCFDCDELRDQVDALDATVAEGIALLREPPE